MWKRMIIMLVVVFALLAAIGFVKYRQIQAAIKQGMSYVPPPEAVTTVQAQPAEWQGTIEAVGSAAAVNGVILSADLPGIVERIEFESGQRVSKGDELMRLDSRQETAQLAAAQAKMDLDRQNLERARGLRAQGVVAQSDLDTASAAFDQSQAGVGEIKATISRKSIRAPFSGVLGIRQINLGQYLKSGDPVVAIQTIDPIYVNFSVPQQYLSRMLVGGEIKVSAEGPESPVPIEKTGKITAVDSLVDEATRNVKVQATFANADGKLRPGMYVKTEITLGTTAQVLPLPSSAIIFAPYGDSVFVVTEMKDKQGKPYKGVRQQFVKLGPEKGDQVAVLSGINPGDEIVSSGGFKLRNGVAVLVNNEVRPSNNPAPQPENN